ncbi:MAG: hypothetical protein DMF76_03280 [Acidobacteria bacterium]|nr:MAG: hypothetical protein DMF76_03280 [Acidobacteriota bacterium]
MKPANWSPSTYPGVKSYGKLRFLDENTELQARRNYHSPPALSIANPKVFAINRVRQQSISS